MTNEELTKEIQAGETELYSELWERVRRFVYDRARRYRLFFPMSLIEVDDLVQAGYLALVETVKTFDPDAGAGLLTHLNFYLKKTWRAMYGIRTSKKDALDRAYSLDEPIDENEETTGHDITPDPSAELAFDQADEKIFIEELRAALEKALDKAPHGDIVRRHYFGGETIPEMAKEYRVSASAIYGRERSALHYLRTGPLKRNLQSFNFYGGTGLNSWKQTGISVQERYILNQERMKPERR